MLGFFVGETSANFKYSILSVFKNVFGFIINWFLVSCPVSSSSFFLTLFNYCLLSSVVSETTILFPGTFDPFTLGHEAIVRRALPMATHLIVAVGFNVQKKSLMTVDKRLEMIRAVFANEPKVEALSYNGLTMEFAKEVGAQLILRGVRNALDFEYESAIAQVNWKMSGIDTLFLLPLEEHSSISSSIVRELLLHHADVSAFLPQNVDIKNYL